MVLGKSMICYLNQTATLAWRQRYARHRIARKDWDTLKVLVLGLACMDTKLANLIIMHACFEILYQLHCTVIKNAWVKCTAGIASYIILNPENNHDCQKFIDSYTMAILWTQHVLMIDAHAVPDPEGCVITPLQPWNMWSMQESLVYCEDYI